MKRILITGGEGFVGQNVKRYFEKRYSLFCPSHKELDLLDDYKVQKYVEDNQVDVIIHSAYQKRNGEGVTLEASEKVYYNLKIFTTLANLGVKMIYFGSGAEYDKDHYVANMSEEYFGKNIPHEPYGYSKYLMSVLTNTYDNVYDMRLFGVYGKGEQYERRFISNAICRAMLERPITIEKNTYFDYIWVDDVCKILEYFIECKPKHQHYNLSSGHSIDLYSLALIVKSVLNANVPIEIKEKGFKLPYTSNNNRLLNEIGKFEFTGYEEGINILYHYYEKQKNILMKIN